MKRLLILLGLVTLGIAESSGAQDGSWGVPPGDGMKAQAGVAKNPSGFHVCYDFTFRLREDSNGIYPAAEQVEIEVSGERNPYGSEGSAFVISIPIGSFSRVGLGGEKNLSHLSYNPPGLIVRQSHESYVFDFVETDGPFVYPQGSAPGVTHFWGLVTQRGEGEGISMRIWIRMTDSRPRELRQAPNFVQLLHGSPTLRIGDDEWKSYLYVPETSNRWGPPTDPLPLHYWECASFFQATWHD